MKYFIYTIIAIVAISVIAGFFIVGSPQEERDRRFDEQRVNDLRQLQSGIINYYLAKNALPRTLTEAETNTFIPVDRDPNSRMQYEYVVKNATTFSLCTTFALPSLPGENSTPMSAPIALKNPLSTTNWGHAAGHTCFDKQIDKDFYKNQQRPL